MANPQNLKPFTGADDPRRVNGAPKGTKHLSTWIQQLLNDEDFTLENFVGGGKQYKGAPIKAIVTVGMLQAIAGEKQWADWLAKYGYGEKLDITSGGEKIEFVNQVPRAE